MNTRMIVVSQLVRLTCGSRLGHFQYSECTFHRNPFMKLSTY